MLDLDEDMPAGFRDADFEMRGLEACAAETAAARRRGLCDHGWQKGNGDGTSTCHHCGKTATDAELRADWNAIHNR